MRIPPPPFPTPFPPARRRGTLSPRHFSPPRSRTSAMTRRFFLAAAFLAAVPLFAVDPAPVPSSAPNYPLAGKFTPDCISQRVHEANITPQRIGKSDQFWSSIRTDHGLKYWRVDPVKRTKVPLFDQEKLTAGLSEAAKKP